MKIAGLQKTTLLDFPGKVCCTIFTDGCNLRCPFCHNASLVAGRRRSPLLPEQEIFAFLEKRKGILDGVCITGGEPLLNKDIKEFIREIKKLGFLVKLDTNGMFPELLKELSMEGYLDYAAMDIKNSKEDYGRTAGIPGFDTRSVEESASFLMQSGMDYEFRTTVVKEFHSEENFHLIGKWLSGCRAYFLQGFMDSGDILKPGLHACEPAEMERFSDILRSYSIPAKLRGIG